MAHVSSEDEVLGNTFLPLNLSGDYAPITSIQQVLCCQSYMRDGEEVCTSPGLHHNLLTEVTVLLQNQTVVRPPSEHCSRRHLSPEW